MTQCDICGTEIPRGTNHVTIERLVERHIERVTRRGDVKVINCGVLEAEALETRCLSCDLALAKAG